MAKIDKWEFPDDLYYDKEHVWVRLEGSIATIGISHFGTELSGEIIYVEAPRIGREVAEAEPFMSMESGKWVGRIKSPLAGKIIEANEELEWESATVNEDPYGEGWLAKLEVTDPMDLGHLLKSDSSELATLIAEERVKYDK